MSKLAWLQSDLRGIEIKNIAYSTLGPKGYNQTLEGLKLF